VTKWLSPAVFTESTCTAQYLMVQHVKFDDTVPTRSLEQNLGLPLSELVCMLDVNFCDLIS